MRERMREMGARLAGPVAVGVVLGLIGPFGTFTALPVLPRLAYWLAVVGLNWLLCDIAIRRVEALAPAALPLRRVTVPLAGAALMAAPATGVVALAGALAGLGWPADVLALFGKVALLLGAVALPAYALADLQEAAAAAHRAPDRAATAPQAPAAAAGPNGAALFAARLPGPLAGPILCLEMQDHYLAVHTAEGSTLILCRMEDAARELAGLGLRVHRSWWVASEALCGVEREGQRLFLRLSDGRRVPVGRTYRDALREAGWLDRKAPLAAQP